MRAGHYPLSARPGWGMVFDEDYLAFARRKD
jgi:hypothetical protein